MGSADSIGEITFNADENDSKINSPYKNIDRFSTFVVDKAAQESYRKRKNGVTMTDFRKTRLQNGIN